MHLRALLASAIAGLALTRPAAAAPDVAVLYGQGKLIAVGGPGPDRLDVHCGAAGLPRVGGVAPSNRVVRCRQVDTVLIYGGGGADRVDVRSVGGRFRDRERDGGDGGRSRGPAVKVYGGGDGDVLLSGGTLAYLFFNGGNGNDGLRGSRNLEIALGGPGEDWVFGRGRRDLLYGGSDGDLLRGGGGNDLIRAGFGNDRVRGGGRGDALGGGRGRDRVRGGRGPDLLLGGPDRDRAFAGPGADFLYGGAGKDLLRGGAGRDRRFQGSSPFVLPGPSAARAEPWSDRLP